MSNSPKESSSSRSYDRCHILSTNCVVVSNIDVVESFFSSIFNGMNDSNYDGQQSQSQSQSGISRYSKPMTYSVFTINEKSTVMIVDRSSCDINLLRSLGCIATRRLLITVSDVSVMQDISSRVNQPQQQSSELNKSANLYVDGPEGLSIHFFYSNTNADFHELLIHSIELYPMKDTATSSISIDSQPAAITPSSTASTGNTASAAINRKTEVRSHTVSANSSQLDSSNEITASSISHNASDNTAYSSTSASNMSAQHPIHAVLAIPTLESSILSNKSRNFVSMPPNCKEAFPFETEFFKGCAVLAVKTDPEDIQFEAYFRKKHTFEVQVQGKFKRYPKGEIYCGAEAENKMELGIITRSCSKAVCQFASTIIYDLHYSFGDLPSKSNYQLPHIVAPLFPTVDKLVVTLPGHKPPEMGIPFVEDLEYRAKRLKFKTIAEANIDIENTYSFSVNTKNIDLTTWNLVNFPMMKKMDMRTFFGTSPIRLVSYEIPDEVAKSCTNLHPVDKLNYAFNIKLASLDEDKIVDVVIDQKVKEITPGIDEGDDDDDALDADNNSDDGNEIDLIDEVDGETETTHRFSLLNKLESSALSPLKNFLQLTKKDNRDGGGLFSRFKKKINEIAPDSIDVPETNDYVPVDYEMEASGDLAYCAAYIEINDLKRSGHRRIAYLMPYADPLNTSVDSQASSPIPLSAAAAVLRLRFYSQIATVFPMLPIPRRHKNKKFSFAEKRRRQVIESYKALVLSDTAKGNKAIHSLLHSPSETDNYFLNYNTSIKLKHDTSNADAVVSYEGHVAMAVSRRHWSEQYVLLTRNSLTIKNSHGSKKVNHTIDAKSIIHIRPMAPMEAILSSSFSYFQIETFSRVYYFLIRSSKTLDEWLNAFTDVLGSTITSKVATSSTTAPHTLNQNQSDLEEAYLAKPSTWKLDKRRLFNYRCIVFNPQGLCARIRDMHPCKLMEGILEKAFLLSSSLTINSSDTHEWMSFMDEISALQIVDVSHLTEVEKISFLLNLYHVMILNGIIILGAPSSWNIWHSFFNTINYQFSFDIVSIAEVEHNMLRANMSKTELLTNMYGKFITPNTHFPDLALSQGDFRLNFCINNGSRSMPKYIPIYRSDYLDRQLDEATMNMLADTVEIDVARKTIWLPTVCKWFLADFTVKKIKTATAISDTLRVLIHYLKSEDKIKLLKVLSDESINPIVKFKPFNYRCRPFAKYDDFLLNSVSKTDSTLSVVSTIPLSASSSYTSTTAAADDSGVGSGNEND